MTAKPGREHHGGQGREARLQGTSSVTPAAAASPSMALMKYFAVVTEKHNSNWCAPWGLMAPHSFLLASAVTLRQAVLKISDTSWENQSYTLICRNCLAARTWRSFINATASSIHLACTNEPYVSPIPAASQQPGHSAGALWGHPVTANGTSGHLPWSFAAL